MRIYIDATVAITIVEEHPVFFPINHTWLSDNATQVIASELTRMENLIVPYRSDDHVIIAEFERFFDSGINGWAPIDSETWCRDARLRAAHVSLKTPDALHVAAAMESRCDAFLTIDKRLSVVTEIPVIVIRAEGT